MRNLWSRSLARHTRRVRGGVLTALITFVASVGAVALPAMPAGAATCPSTASTVGHWIGTWSNANSDVSGSYRFDLNATGGNNLAGTLTNTQYVTTLAQDVALTGGTSCNRLSLLSLNSTMTAYELILDGTLSANGTRVSGAWSDQTTGQSGTWSAGLSSRTVVGGYTDVNSDPSSEPPTVVNPIEAHASAATVSPPFRLMSLKFARSDVFRFNNFGNANGYVWLDPVVEVSAPDNDYLNFVDFFIDASVTRGVGAGNIGVNYNGGFIGQCPSTPACVRSRQELAGGDVFISLEGRGGDNVYAFSVPSNPKPEFFVGSSSVAEGSSTTAGTVRTLQVPITLSSPLSTTAKVHYSTRPVTADSSDFTPKSGTLTFLPGVTRKVVAVKITPDDVYEGDYFSNPNGDETFEIVLDTPVGAALGRDVSSQTILGDECECLPSTPVLMVGDASIGEGDSGLARAVTIPVNLSAPAATDTDVVFTISGTATSGTDYTVGAARKIRFLAGQVNKLVTVKVIPDVADEGRAWCDGVETVQLTATSITGGLLITRPVGTLSICDDD